MTYYDVRNMLIGMAGSKNCASAQEVIHHISNRVVGAMDRYRYEDAEIIYEAIDDFYKGPDFFKTIDPLEKHAALAKYNYKYDDQNRMTESEALKWNSTKNTWGKDMCIRYAYQGKTMTTTYYKWNNKKGEYILVPEMTVIMDNPNM